MGWFTNRSKSWELKNMWSVFLSLLLLPLYVIGIQAAFVVAMGIIVKKRNWIIISGLIYVINFVIFIISDNVGVFVIGSLLHCLYTAFIIKEYLQRLDLKKSGVKLEWRKKYKYDKNTDNSTLIKLQSDPFAFISSQRDAFIADLLTYKERIDNLSIKEDIEKMLQIVDIYEKRNTSESEKFFIRHKDIVKKILKQYDDIEDTGLDNELMNQSKDTLEESIHLVTIAFQNELTTQFKTEN